MDDAGTIGGGLARTLSQPRAAGFESHVLPLAAERRTAALKACGTGASRAVTAAARVHKIQNTHKSVRIQLYSRSTSTISSIANALREIIHILTPA